MARLFYLIFATIREHSQKPDEVKDRILQLVGDLPRIELFAREKTEGWDVWGNEVESDIDLAMLKEDK
jgi:site-specific DNA-methyltransferase (adenine-specific)